MDSWLFHFLPIQLLLKQNALNLNLAALEYECSFFTFEM